VQYKLSLPDDLRDDPHRFMVVQFTDKLRSVLCDGGAKESEKNIDGISGNSLLLVAFRNRIFEVQCDFQVMERRGNFDAIGCGQDFCLGSLHATEGSKLKPTDRIKKALECAAQFSAGVRGPFVVECL